jgi:hypothetical protein
MGGVLPSRTLARRCGYEVGQRVEHRQLHPRAETKGSGTVRVNAVSGHGPKGTNLAVRDGRVKKPTCCQGVDVAGLPTLAEFDRGGAMANPVPAGSDVSSGTYRCTSCDNEIQMESKGHIPPCPSCGKGEWDTVRGGDSVNDPYPDR